MAGDPARLRARATSADLIKHLQSFEYRSAEWRAWSGLRQHVESNNKFIKDDAHTDLGNSTKRRARGFAYQFLTFAVAATVANMRRIVTFIAKTAQATVPAATLRARRPTDTDGTPLAHPTVSPQTP